MKTSATDDQIPPVQGGGKEKLWQCCRCKCEAVGFETEKLLVPDKQYPSCRRHVCPHCGHDTFYELKADGIRKNMYDDRDGVDPNDISPNPRLGPKTKAKLLAAKERALGRDKP